MHIKEVFTGTKDGLVVYSDRVYRAAVPRLYT